MVKITHEQIERYTTEMNGLVQEVRAMNSIPHLNKKLKKRRREILERLHELEQLQVNGGEQ